MFFYTLSDVVKIQNYKEIKIILKVFKKKISIDQS